MKINIKITYSNGEVEIIKDVIHYETKSITIDGSTFKYHYITTDNHIYLIKYNSVKQMKVKIGGSKYVTVITA